jgi:hypothetical protein
VSFSFGCVLGDAIPGFDPAGCPARPGYTTHNEATGGCTISPGTVLLYNEGQAPAPNCDTQPDAQGRTWAEAADHFTPKVVVINVAGFEIVDRWLNFVVTPDSQWGAAGCSPSNTPSPTCDAYVNAAASYSNELKNAIDTFRGRGATVLVANAPYTDPPEPVPPPSVVSDPAFQCTWWEPNDATAPVSTGPDCDGNGNPGSGGSWRPPATGLTYRSSHTKFDQLNGITDLVKNRYFGTDNDVWIFNFRKHFNLAPNASQYTDYVCPPPNDSTEAPNLNTNPPSCAAGPAIFARDVDHSHLSPAGEFNILQPYLESCVKNLLGIGGNVADCS